MRQLHDPGAGEALILRARALDPAARPRWGSFTVPRMLCHVTDALRVGLGQIEGHPVKSVLRLPVLNTLVATVLPWPQGAPSYKEAFTTQPQAVDADLEALDRALREFLECDLRGRWPEHPLFGRIGGGTWSRLMYRHVDHHLRQFGA